VNAIAVTGQFAQMLQLLGGGLILAGFALLAWAWRVLRSARQRGLLSVKGPYSYVRHPQYVSLIAMALGLLLASPTLATLLLFSLAAWNCVRLAGREDGRMAREFGWCWRAYAYGRPAFAPRLSRIHLALTDLGRFARRCMEQKAWTAGAGAPPTHGRTRS